MTPHQPAPLSASKRRSVMDTFLCAAVLSDEVATALASSALLQPYFRGRLGPKTFLVRPETAAELGKKLPAYGLSVGRDLLFADP